MERRKTGRPKKEIDLEALRKLCELQCSAAEISGFFGITVETLNRIIKDTYEISFLEYFEQNRSGGKIALRRKQFSVAMDGNPSMLIWLGKNWLKQVDKQEVTHTGDTGVVKVRIVDEDSSND